jgi:nucleotide-binding universal stress UspA family protein
VGGLRSPTAFSINSIYALKEAISLNKKLKYELIIFHAFSRPYSESKEYHQSTDKLEKAVDRKFDLLLEELPEIKSYTYHFKKRLGYSIEMILDQVEKDQPDLIIMNTKGAVGLGELWGTKTAKIIKSVSVPVIVVPSSTSLTNFTKIGLACDYSENTDYDHLDFLIGLAELNKLEIDIITLNRQEKTMTRKELDNRKRILGLMEHLPAKVSFTHHENVKAGLIDYCKKNEIGMLSILPKSYPFIERVFHDSLTMRMAFHSPVPLLVLK